jgi:hypothetical protein
MADYTPLHDTKAMVQALLGDRAVPYPTPDVPTYNTPQGFTGGINQTWGNPIYRGGYTAPIPGGAVSVGGHYQPNQWGPQWGIRGTLSKGF